MVMHPRGAGQFLYQKAVPFQGGVQLVGEPAGGAGIRAGRAPPPFSPVKFSGETENVRMFC